MKFWPLVSAITGALALGGCASTSTMHYDLNTPSVANVSAPNAKPVAAAYTLTGVAVPDPIDIAALVVRQPNDSLLVLSHDKWVAPLNQVMKMALTDGLTRQLGMPPLQGVMNNPLMPQSGVDQVVVDVQQFDLRPAQQASLGALWRIDFYDKRIKDLTCYSVFSESVGPGVLALVNAQQKNVQALSAQIAQAIRTKSQPNGANCRLSS